MVSKKNGGDQAPEDNNNTGSELQPEAMMITAKHSFAGGKHIVAGEVQVPTPCTSLDVKAVVGGTDSSQVTLVFQTINESEACVQVIANRRFKVEFNAPEKAEITATWNGAPAVLNLIPTAAGENLENFEIFLKG